MQIDPKTLKKIEYLKNWHQRRIIREIGDFALSIQLLYSQGGDPVTSYMPTYSYYNIRNIHNICNIYNICNNAHHVRVTHRSRTPHYASVKHTPQGYVYFVIIVVVVVDFWQAMQRYIELQDDQLRPCAPTNGGGPAPGGRGVQCTKEAIQLVKAALPCRSGPVGALISGWLDRRRGVQAKLLVRYRVYNDTFGITFYTP